jgi:hypothetical protein
MQRTADAILPDQVVGLLVRLAQEKANAERVV